MKARRRLALPTTVTDEKAMAAPASSGLSSNPKKGNKTPIAIGNPQDVVDERADQVLLDVAHSGPADLDGGHHTLQAALDQRDIRSFDGHIRAGADRQTHIGLRQRRSVVDAVADHRDLLAFGLQHVNVVRFVFRQDFGQHPVHAHLASNGFSRAAVVAGDHHHFDAHLAAARQWLPRNLPSLYRPRRRCRPPARPRRRTWASCHRPPILQPSDSRSPRSTLSRPSSSGCRGQPAASTVAITPWPGMASNAVWFAQWQPLRAFAPSTIASANGCSTTVPPKRPGAAARPYSRLTTEIQRSHRLVPACLW